MMALCKTWLLAAYFPNQCSLVIVSLDFIGCTEILNDEWLAFWTEKQGRLALSEVKNSLRKH